MTIKLVIYVIFACLAFEASGKNNTNKETVGSTKYGYNDYANNSDHNAPISREKNKKVTVPLTNYFNEIYYAKVTIGNPPQKFSLLVSTALSFMYVPALNNLANKTKAFDPSKSTTAKCKTNPWSINGLLGSHVLNGSDISSGLVTCEDTVRFGDVTLNKQTFGLANLVDPYFYGDTQQSDGILGLGLPSTNIFKADTVLNSINKQIRPDKKIFSIWLNLNYLNTKRGGEITFGGLNTNLFSGPMYYVPLTTPNVAWNIKVESFSFGSTVLDTNFQALVDVGDECINLPFTVLQQISSTINQDLYSNPSVPCNITSTLPSISFNIKTSNYGGGRHTFTIDPSTYVQPAPEEGKCYFCISSYDNSTSKLSKTWVLGDPFISQFYTVFDAEKQQLGFAKALRI